MNTFVISKFAFVSLALFQKNAVRSSFVLFQNLASGNSTRVCTFNKRHKTNYINNVLKQNNHVTRFNRRESVQLLERRYFEGEKGETQLVGNVRRPTKSRDEREK